MNATDTFRCGACHDTFPGEERAQDSEGLEYDLCPDCDSENKPQ